MNEAHPAGHAFCATCKATFPRSWFKTRAATSKNGRDFCSQKCSDNYIEPLPAQPGVPPSKRWYPSICRD